MLRLFTNAQAFAAQQWYALRDREEGQTMAEYGVVLAVITLGIMVVLGLLSESIQGKLQQIVDTLG